MISQSYISSLNSSKKIAFYCILSFYRLLFFHWHSVRSFIKSNMFIIFSFIIFLVLNLKFLLASIKLLFLQNARFFIHFKMINIDEINLTFKWLLVPLIFILIIAFSVIILLVKICMRVFFSDCRKIAENTLTDTKKA